MSPSQSTCHYVIEVIDVDDCHYAQIIVIGPTVDAGTVPSAITRHADQLRRIAGPTASHRIGWHLPCVIDFHGPVSSARTVWLTEETRAR